KRLIHLLLHNFNFKKYHNSMKERPSGVVLNTISKGASPESKCPICLDHFKNISYLDVCLHKFCFCCIREWSK
uniref:RING-type E3 ubiquitin transferase n=1 Tax=Cyprinus carpio TaxID=7962 RepID=A0A8C2H016_CYPCA